MWLNDNSLDIQFMYFVDHTHIYIYSVLEKKFNNETLAATYKGNVMTIMMFGIV